jgi:hypothetical protein
MRKKQWIYLIVLVPLAFFYEPIKNAISNNVLFFALALCVIVMARLIANKFGE